MKIALPLFRVCRKAFAFIFVLHFICGRIKIVRVRRRSRYFSMSGCKEMEHFSRSPYSNVFLCWKSKYQSQLSFNATKYQLIFSNYFELTDSTGNFCVINGFHLSHNLTSRTIDVNSLKHFAMSNLVSLDLKNSNVNRVSTILHGDLPSLKTLSFENCNGIMDSDVTSLQGVPNLGNQ